MPGPRYLFWTVPTALADSFPLPVCWLQLTLFKRGGVRFRSYAVPDSLAARQTRPGSEPWPLAHGVNSRVPLGLESHFRPVKHEWLYRIARKIIQPLKPYHNYNVGTQSAGYFNPSLFFRVHGKSSKTPAAAAQGGCRGARCLIWTDPATPLDSWPDIGSLHHVLTAGYFYAVQRYSHGISIQYFS